MALIFQAMKTATISARLSDEAKNINIDGCNAAETSVDNAAAQINKLLAVVGRSVNADSRMFMTFKKEAVNNG